ncbi:hypothetical protein ACF065_19015 [Streptomyces sp. NPDC015232]|uniref:hypothetical protein n=1 Tax=unclassified Streptomyces TaxID=2593676 RepID=UPI003700DE9A
MTTAMRTRRFASVLLAGSFALVACGQGEERKAGVAVEEQCGGIFAAAAPALKRALGTEEFADLPTEGWLDSDIERMVSEYERGVSSAARYIDCGLATADEPRRHLGVVFGMYGEQSLGSHAADPYMYPYDMGVEAEAGYRRAYLYVECTSPQLKGSDKRPARFVGSLGAEESTTPDTAATREDNLVILHSAMLAFVRKLGCVNDAGLPATPVIKPKEPSRVWPQGPVR